MTATLKLPCDLVIDDAKAIAKEWLDIIAGCRDRIVIDAAATENADTAGIQLLLALAKQAQANNIDVEISHPSARVLMMLRAMGVTNRFKITP